MKTIEIYGQPNCRYCVGAKNHCERHGLAYTYRDITDPTARAEMFMRNPNAQSVPQIFIGDTHIPGGHDELVEIPIATLQQMIGE